MTKEELIDLYVEANPHFSGAWGELRDLLNSFADELTPSLPEGLDEAADNHIRKVIDAAGHPGWDWTTQDIAGAFIAGAEWMAGQGETRELIVARGATENYIGGFVVDENKFHSGEEVIVQIRKK